MQFWQQQKDKEAEHKQAVSAHEKEKQDRLAASKAAEQKRLEEQAKSTISSMEQQRQQDTAAFRAQEAERAAAQAKAREANAQRVLADTQQRKAASAVTADAAHGVKAPAPAPAARPTFQQPGTHKIVVG